MIPLKVGDHVTYNGELMTPRKSRMATQVVPPFQIIIIGRLVFLTLNLITYLIQKIYTNIVKFELFLKTLY